MTEKELHREIETAIRMLSKECRAKISDLTLFLENDDLVMVASRSNWIDLINLTKKRAAAELIETKTLFSKMLAVSPVLSEFIEEKTVCYLLFYDNGGKCSIDICLETEGKTDWKMALQD